MNLQYLLLRLVRHFIPESVARFLLKRRWIIQPGLESSDPLAAVRQYIETLSQYEKSIKGHRVLVFGYGGRFAVGVELLRQGASHVVLCDHFVLLDKERNRELLPEYSDYLVLEGDDVKPRAEFITLLHGDIREIVMQDQITKVDFVLSTSVFEHLDDVDGVAFALSCVTSQDGVQLHFVDLRDHYFKYPFEMLAFPKWIWEYLLNPTSNLNRYRLPAYQNIFAKYFPEVVIDVLARQEKEFNKIQNRVRSEFLTGDLAVDSVTLIKIVAKNPINESK